VIEPTKKAEYAEFLQSEQGKNILLLAGFGQGDTIMKNKKKEIKVLMDLSDTPFELIKDSVKGVKLQFDIFSDKEKSKIREIQQRKNISGFQP
jgi:basic membrane lipoprotein Med (substrate-binding protein (PBP1-ABC) superfamily)